VLHAVLDAQHVLMMQFVTTAFLDIYMMILQLQKNVQVAHHFAQNAQDQQFVPYVMRDFT